MCRGEVRAIATLPEVATCSRLVSYLTSGRLTPGRRMVIPGRRSETAFGGHYCGCALGLDSRRHTALHRYPENTVDPRATWAPPAPSEGSKGTRSRARVVSSARLAAVLARLG